MNHEDSWGDDPFDELDDDDFAEDPVGLAWVTRWLEDIVLVVWMRDLARKATRDSLRRRQNGVRRG